MTADREYQNMIDRSERFLKSAEWNLNEGFIDISAFSVNQSLELLIKALLLRKLGDFPHTHDIKTLLRTLVETVDSDNSKKISRFLAEKSLEINVIQDAYITSRYFFTSISMEDLKNLVNVVKEFREEFINVP